jgi:hypothetical protein
MIKSILLRLVLESDPELNQNDMNGRIRIRNSTFHFRQHKIPGAGKGQVRSLIRNNIKGTVIHSGSISLPGAGNPCSVQTPGRLLRVSPVVHLNEGEAGGPASHPHVLHYAVLAEGVL